MKLLALLVLASLLSFNAHASESEKMSAQVKKQVLAKLRANPAIRGAMLEAKHWAGGTTCGAIELDETTKDSFTAYVTCANQPDPKEEEKAGVGLEADAQVEIHGTVYYGDKESAPITLQIDKLQFNYAG